MIGIDESVNSESTRRWLETISFAFSVFDNHLHVGGSKEEDRTYNHRTPSIHDLKSVLNQRTRSSVSTKNPFVIVILQAFLQHCVDLIACTNSFLNICESCDMILQSSYDDNREAPFSSLVAPKRSMKLMILACLQKNLFPISPPNSLSHQQITLAIFLKFINKTASGIY